MSNFRSPDLQQRKQTGAEAKKALFEKFKAAASDPRLEEKAATRQAIAEARALRMAERQVEKEKRQAELDALAAQDAQAARERQLEADEERKLLALEAAEKQKLLLAEQKAARDARYASRKAAKKARRKG